MGLSSIAIFGKLITLKVLQTPLQKYSKLMIQNAYCMDHKTARNLKFEQQKKKVEANVSGVVRKGWMSCVGQAIMGGVALGRFAWVTGEDKITANSHC